MTISYPPLLFCVNYIFMYIQQGGQTQTLTLQPAQPPQGQPDGQNQTTVVAPGGQQGQQQQQQFLQVPVEGSRYLKTDYIRYTFYIVFVFILRVT